MADAAARSSLDTNSGSTKGGLPGGWIKARQDDSPATLMKSRRFEVNSRPKCAPECIAQPAIKKRSSYGLSTYSSFASCAGWRCELVGQNLMWNFSLMQVAVQRCTLIGMTFFSLSPELTLVWSRATYSAFAASALSGSTRKTSRSSAIPSCHRPSRHSASA
jgi:hypothetical protein